MQITAAVARDIKQPFTVETLELDELRPNEVRVRLVATGICHTDAIVRDGIYPTPLPAVLGHEGAGIVEATGSAVSTVDIGDKVILAAAYCGKCGQCRQGQMVYCENLFAVDFGGRRSDGTTSLSSGVEVISSHFFGQSSFGTFANVVEECLVKVDQDVPLELVAPLGCGLQTGAGTVLNELRPALGSTVVVLGMGAVGSGAIMAAQVAGCSRIIAVDIHESRLQLSLELGATDTVNSKEGSFVEQIMTLTGGKGVDYIVDTTALPALLQQAAGALAIRGTLALVGAAAPGTEVQFEIGASLVKGWTFKTVVQGSSVPQVFIPRLVQLWKDGKFPIDKLIQHYSLEDINQGFADSASGAVIKPVIVF